jgi:fructokinase
LKTVRVKILGALMNGKIIGAVELGGTKIVCGLFHYPPDDCPDNLPELIIDGHIPTTAPDETFRNVSLWFDKNLKGNIPSAFGIASFGPIDPRPSSKDFGKIINTPKPGWSHVDVAGFFRKLYGVHAAFDTDVNGAALAEYLWGAGINKSCAVYITIGTGIGGGAVVNGRIYHGTTHPEMGHIQIPLIHGDEFKGVCPFHGGCFEGMASGPAVEKRWNTRGETLPEGHPAWTIESKYIASGLSSITMALAPDRIILGGGIGGRKDILELVRKELPSYLGGYLSYLDNTEKIEDFLVHPGLGGKAGIFGAAALAIDDYRCKRNNKIT